MKQGAMFGLDARIALAIFGALSVISGAALYSAIQDSKATALYQESREIIKSFEALYLDLGYLPTHISGSTKVDIRYLYSNPANISTWKGPYYEVLKENNNSSAYNSKYVIEVIKDASFVSTSFKCDGYSPDANGGNYIKISHVPSSGGGSCESDISVLKPIHDKFDTDSDYENGNILVLPKTADATKGAIYFKISDTLY
jgi:type II secretory pathway pseudopilin PulG